MRLVLLIQRSGRTSSKVCLAFAGDDDARVSSRDVSPVQYIYTTCRGLLVVKAVFGQTHECCVFLHQKDELRAAISVRRPEAENALRCKRELRLEKW
jgi:hypothetical protein